MCLPCWQKSQSQVAVSPQCFVELFDCQLDGWRKDPEGWRTHSFRAGWYEIESVEKRDNPAINLTLEGKRSTERLRCSKNSLLAVLLPEHIHSEQEGLEHVESLMIEAMNEDDPYSVPLSEKEFENLRDRLAGVQCRLLHLLHVRRSNLIQSLRSSQLIGGSLEMDGE